MSNWPEGIAPDLRGTYVVIAIAAAYFVGSGGFLIWFFVSRALAG